MNTSNSEKESTDCFFDVHDNVSSEEPVDEGAVEVEQPEAEEQRRRSSRNGKPPSRLAYRANRIFDVPITTSDEPTVKEAMNATKSEVDLWRKAISVELQTLSDNRTWKEIDNVEHKKGRMKNHNGHTILLSHVVLRLKRNEKGNAETFKARVVAGGHLQVKGMDYDAVYAPVINFSLVLSTLAIAVQYDWSLYQVDVKAAFLNGDIDKVTYVSHPVNVPPDMRKSVYYELLKALFGLHQAPLCWFNKLKGILVDLFDAKQLNSDRSVFMIEVQSNGAAHKVLVLCYVGDLIFAGKWSKVVNDIVDKFLSVLEGTKKPLVSWYLGVRIQQSVGKCYVSQTAYLYQTLTEYGLQNVRTYSTRRN